MPGCTLVMDTSSSPLLIALEKQGHVYSSRRKGIKQEKLLFPVLRRLLGKAQADLKDVTRILIIRGPGRFTGIRIALTVASMMQLLNQTKVYGVTLFEVLAYQTRISSAYKKWHEKHPTGVLAVVLHAFRQEYFLQIFDETAAPPQWLSYEQLQAQLAGIQKPLFVCGTDKDFASLDNLLGKAYTLAPYKQCRVQAKTLLTLAREGVGACQALEPLYLKPARFEQEVPK